MGEVRSDESANLEPSNEPGGDEQRAAQPSAPARPRAAQLPYGLVLAIVGLTYFGVAKLGLSFAADNEVVSAVWPPSGLALAAVVLLGYRVWPAIAVAALVANATGDSSIITAAQIAAGNALAAVTGGYLLSRAGFDPRLRRIRDVIALAILGAAVSTSINASIGVSALWASGVVEPATYWSFWRVWWLGDLTGVLIVAPALMVAIRGMSWPSLDRTLLGAGVLIVALVAVTLLVLSGEVTLAYPVFPLIVLAAIWFRQPGAAVAAVIVSSLAIAYTAADRGPFASSDAELNLLSAQLFVALAAVTGLLVAAIRSEWDRAHSAMVRFEEGARVLTDAQALAHIGSWEWEIEPNRVLWSDELYRIFGLDPERFDASYESYLACIHPEDRAVVEAAVRRTFETAEPFELEHRIVRPTGEERTLSCRGRAVCGAEGRPDRILGIAQDVTEHRMAQELFRSLLESAPDAMVIVDERGEIVLVNSQAERLFGYQRAELIGRPVEILLPVDAREVHPGHRQRFAADPHPRPMGSGLDLTAVRKDGTQVPVEISLSPLKTAERLLVSSAIRDITERQLTQRQLEHQALHDPLTDLPNRVLFMDRLGHALTRARRQGSKLAVFFCDIDDFKNVNDSLGHEVGDDLLVALPPRLRRALREADTVARFGGDEFVLLCEDLTSQADSLAIAERIGDAFERPLEVGGREHHISVSVGIVFDEGGEASAAEILRDADVAMYRAKRGGRGRFELFDARMRATVVARLDIEAGLRRALEANALRLLFQPIVSLERNAFVGAEALLRWDHPERGLLLPADFIGVAEESGLIIPIGAWVLDKACNMAAGWPPANGSQTRISINLSLRQASDPKIAELLDRTLAESGVDPEAVNLEITESALMERGPASIGGNLERLRDLGVRLVLDDFGTGYSSLSRLKHFPIDALKIDRAFIAGVGSVTEDDTIVASMLAMARALDIDVVAEGVETVEQLAWLRRLRCPYAQGYLFARPLVAAELEQLSPWGGGRQPAASMPAGTS